MGAFRNFVLFAHRHITTVASCFELFLLCVYIKKVAVFGPSDVVWLDIFRPILSRKTLSAVTARLSQICVKIPQMYGHLTLMKWLLVYKINECHSVDVNPSGHAAGQSEDLFMLWPEYRKCFNSCFSVSSVLATAWKKESVALVLLSCIFLQNSASFLFGDFPQSVRSPLLSEEHIRPTALLWLGRFQQKFFAWMCLAVNVGVSGQFQSVLWNYDLRKRKQVFLTNLRARAGGCGMLEEPAHTEGSLRCGCFRKNPREWKLVGQKPFSN